MKRRDRDENYEPFWTISLISWLLFLITGWLSLGLPYTSNYFKIIWLTISYNPVKDSKPFIPLEIYYPFHYIVFIILLILATLSFYIYIKQRNNTNLMMAMLGNITKFHFIPLISVSALFIIGNSIQNAYNKDISDFTNDAMFIFDFLFTIIGLVSIIIIYVHTKIDSPFYAYLAIKKGTYSSLIVLLVYNIGFNVVLYGYYCLGYDKDSDPGIWGKACGITFSIFIGFINSFLSVIFKDLIMVIMNILIYIGMTIKSFTLDKDDINYDEKTEGIIDIVIISIDFSIIIYIMLIKYCHIFQS